MPVLEQQCAMSDDNSSGGRVDAPSPRTDGNAEEGNGLAGLAAHGVDCSARGGTHAVAELLADVVGGQTTSD